MIFVPSGVRQFETHKVNRNVCHEQIGKVKKIRSKFGDNWFGIRCAMMGPKSSIGPAADSNYRETTTNR